MTAQIGPLRAIDYSPIYSPADMLSSVLLRDFDVKYRFSRGKTHVHYWQEMSLSLQSIEDAQVVNTTPNGFSGFIAQTGGYPLRQNRSSCFLGAVPSILVPTPCPALDALLPSHIATTRAQAAATSNRRTSFSFLSMRKCHGTSRKTLRRNC